MAKTVLISDSLSPIFCFVIGHPYSCLIFKDNYNQASNQESTVVPRKHARRITELLKKKKKTVQNKNMLQECSCSCGGKWWQWLWLQTTGAGPVGHHCHLGCFNHFILAILLWATHFQAEESGWLISISRWWQSTINKYSVHMNYVGSRAWALNYYDSSDYSRCGDGHHRVEPKAPALPQINPRLQYGQ